VRSSAWHQKAALPHGSPAVARRDLSPMSSTPRAGSPARAPMVCWGRDKFLPFLLRADAETAALPEKRCSKWDGFGNGSGGYRLALLPIKAGHRRLTAHETARYRCFLPDLAGLAGFHRVRPMSDQSRYYHAIGDPSSHAESADSCSLAVSSEHPSRGNCGAESHEDAMHSLQPRRRIYLCSCRR
jgi:hypothetical protein